MVHRMKPMDDAERVVIAETVRGLLGLAVSNGAIALFGSTTEAERDAFAAGYDVLVAFWPAPASESGLASLVIKGADVLTHADPARTADVRMNAIPVEGEAIARALDVALKVLESQGARIVEVRMPDVSDVPQYWGVMCSHEMAAAHAATFPARAAEYGPYLRAMLADGRPSRRSSSRRRGAARPP